jgi:hypothetical protein
MKVLLAHIVCRRLSSVSDSTELTQNPDILKDAVLCRLVIAFNGPFCFNWRDPCSLCSLLDSNVTLSSLPIVHNSRYKELSYALPIVRDCQAQRSLREELAQIWELIMEVHAV